MTLKELKEKVDTKTLNFVLFTIITAGIYPIIWLTKYMETIEEVVKAERSNTNYPLFLAITVGLGSNLASGEIPLLAILALVLSLLTWVLYIIWAFKIKKALLSYTLNECKINYSMNPFYTAIFSVYYINYCINELSEVLEREEIIKNSSKD